MVLTSNNGATIQFDATSFLILVMTFVILKLGLPPPVLPPPCQGYMERLDIMAQESGAQNPVEGENEDVFKPMFLGGGGEVTGMRGLEPMSQEV